MESKASVKEITEQPVSTADHLQLLEYEPISFAGIHEGMMSVIVLPEGNNFIGFHGDQGVGKTSNLNFVKTLLGGEEPENSVSSVDKDKKGSFKLSKNGVDYAIRQTKTSFSITRIDPDGTKYKVESPKAFLRDLIGPIGISPMFLKEKKGPEQIQYIRSLSKVTKDQLQDEEKIKDDLKKKVDKRTDINRDVKKVRTELAETGYYTWDEENKYFIPADKLKVDELDVNTNDLNEDQVREKFKTANDKVARLNSAKARLDHLKERRVQLGTMELAIEAKIAELQKDLQALRDEKKSNEDSVKTGEAFVLENLSATEELEKMQIDVTRLGEIKIKKQNIVNAKEKYHKYDELEQEQMYLNDAIIIGRTELKEFIKTITPKIEGLEVVVNDGIDNEREEGIYYFGKTPQMLSESELYAFCLQLWTEQNVRVVIIEDISKYGSKAVECIEWFANNGGYVFYSAMERNRKELKVTFSTSVPE